MTLEKELKVWEMEKSQVEILENYIVDIIADKEDSWEVEFFDEEGNPVWAKSSKKLFQNLPYPIEVGSSSILVLYKLKGEENPRIDYCPLIKYWHPSWQKEKNSSESS